MKLPDRKRVAILKNGFGQAETMRPGPLIFRLALPVLFNEILGPAGARPTGRPAWAGV